MNYVRKQLYVPMNIDWGRVTLGMSFTAVCVTVFGHGVFLLLK